MRIKIFEFSLRADTGLIILLAFGLRQRAIAIRLHCHSLTQFLHPLEGKCIVVDCRVDSATTPPPISSQQLGRSSLYHRRSSREESKWLFSPPLLIDFGN